MRCSNLHSRWALVLICAALALAVPGLGQELHRGGTKSVKITSVDLEVYGYGATALTEAQEDSPGLAVRLNNNDTNANSVPDRTEDSVPGEADLAHVKLKFTSQGGAVPSTGTLTLTADPSGKIRFWKSPSKGATNLLGPNGWSRTWNLADSAPPNDVDLYLEGCNLTSLAGVTLKLKYDNGTATPTDDISDTVKAVVAGADLAVTGGDEKSEDTVGGFVSLNSDYDEGMTTAGGAKIRDNAVNPATTTPQIIYTDDDLVEIVLRCQDAAAKGKWKITYPEDKLLLWKETNATTHTWSKVSSDTLSGDETWTTEPLEVRLKLEGIAVASKQDIAASFTPDGGTAITDAIKLTVFRLDLDVDANGSLADAGDGVETYLPGYEGNVHKSSVGTEYWNPQYKRNVAGADVYGQAMRLILDGVGTGSGVSVSFTLSSCTNLSGFCEGTSDADVAGIDTQGDDFSFEMTNNNRNAGRTSIGTLTVTGAPTLIGGTTATTTWTPLWCKDYGGKCVVSLVGKVGTTTVLTRMITIPIDKDSDGIADCWELDQVTKWNTEYPTAKKTGDPLAAFGAATDSEPKGKHKTSGDGRGAFREYRGYILDGGGDWRGVAHVWNNGAAGTVGGHVRLSPVHKELLVEVDAMDSDAGKIPTMPTAGAGTHNQQVRAGLKVWMDAVANSTGNEVADSAGKRGSDYKLFYVVDKVDTTYTTFTAGVNPMQTNLANYANAERNSLLAACNFKHLQFAAKFDGSAGSDGLTFPPPSTAGATVAMTAGSANAAAPATNIAFATYGPALVAHELHHTYVTDLGSDGGGHFNDTDGNGVGAEAPDKYLVLWNYNYAYPQKTLAANVAAGATEIQVMDVTNMPAEGTVTLGAETLRYTSIRNEAGPPARHFLCGFVLAAPHIAGAAVKVREASNDFKHVWYGPGTVKHGTIN